MTNNYLPTDYQNFIALSRYSRWLEDENRRETWAETVARYFNFMEKHLQKNHGYTLTKELRQELEDAVLNTEVMPSMRALMTAGPALERDNVGGFNCSMIAIDTPRAFDEMMYVLMCGTGVGFSVERQFVSHLPTVNEHFEKSSTVIVVDDSKAGWCRALRELIAMLYAGQIPSWDVSKVRPAGARLKTFGGRASGPEPLVSLFQFCVKTFQGAAGRKLTSLECHDIACKIGEIVVVGGVRRSALISLSNLSDDRMRKAKAGAWWEKDAQRALANNSAVYTDERPEMSVFMDEWKALYESRSGERGIFSRYASWKQVAKSGRRAFGYGKNGDPIFAWADRDKVVDYIEFGTNPCSEIVLRPDGQFCNLSEVVVRPTDTLESLKRKARLASILGTFQSTLTNFKYIRRVWKENTEEERLLGVSLTGILDHPLLSGKGDKVELIRWLEDMRGTAIETNAEFADSIGIQRSTAVTAVKPSGTVSQLCDSASGIHPRFARYYIRRVRQDVKDPLTSLMKDAGVPWEADVMKPNDTVIFSFPMRSPDTAVLRDEMTAIEQLELWLIYLRHWTEHKPSITVYVREHEWMEVGAWCYKHFDELTGVSFLPYDNGTYRQAPYEEITKEDYETLKAQMPKSIDWNLISLYEKTDSTTGSQELACVAGGCEI